MNKLSSILLLINTYRVISSTQLEDRRDAVRAIKSLSKKYKNEVGTLCTEVLLDVLRRDKMDSEIVGYSVETLWNVTEMDRLGSGEDKASRPEMQFSEVIVKNQENITLLLGILEDFEFSVRRPATVLLWALLQNKRAEMQEAILIIPQGISRVIDLLSDSREVIRNDAILLLNELTMSNKQIQKIVAFENAFDRLLAIVSEEGYSDGGIVVEDCVNVLLNLLKANNSNQSYFRETNLVNHLVPFFDFRGSDGNTWSPQKVANVLRMLSLIRTLVSPNNPQQSTTLCQKLILQCQLLETLCGFMFAGGVPTEILTDTITTVAEAMRGCDPCQKFLETVSTPSTPPRSAILAILMSMVTEKQPLILRISALYFFICYVYKNEDGQCNVINTLLPSSTQPTSITPGQILIAGLFGSDPLSNWCTAVAISNALNDGLKPQLLRVQLSMQGGSQVTLLQQITMFLSQHSDLRVQTRVGLLILLCTWLADCSLGVTQFLSDTTNVPFLIGQLEHSYSDELGQLSRCLCAVLLGISLAYNTGSSPEYTQETLRQIIEHRIGKDAFVECLRHISSSEFFTRAAKNPQNRALSLDDVCFDYNFTVFFKQVSDVIIRSLDSNFVPHHQQQHQQQHQQNLASQSQSNGSMVNVDTSMEDHDSIVNQYKDLIRDQDEELTALREKHASLEKLRSEDAGALRDQMATISTLQEQVTMYAMMKDSIDGGGGGGPDSDQTASSSEVDRLQSTIVSMQRLQDSQRQELAAKNVEVEKLQQQVKKLSKTQRESGEANQSEITQLRDELSQVVAEKEALLTYRQSMEEEIEALRGRLSQAQVDSDASGKSTQQEVEALRGKLSQAQVHSEASRKSMEQEVEALRGKLSQAQVDSEASRKSMEQEVEALRGKLSQAQVHSEASRKSMQQEIDTLLAKSDSSQGGEELEQRKVRQLEESLKETTEKLGLVEKEQDDLLVLLSENDTKIKKYRALLIEKGVDIPEDEEEEEEESDESEEEEEEGAGP